MARLAKLKFTVYTSQMDTPRVLSDASGKIVWSWESKPFGETKPNEDPDQDGIALRYNQRFPGQTYDAETGLHYNFHRDYNPQTGRDVQSDPIGLEGGMNTFGYVGGNSLFAWDTSGYYPTTINKIFNSTRTINFSIDVHNNNGSGQEIRQTLQIIKNHPKIKFTVYVYNKDKDYIEDLIAGKAAEVGLHVGPSVSLTDITTFYGSIKNVPASIHGAGTNRLTSRQMSALAVSGRANFVRAASPNGNSSG